MDFSFYREYFEIYLIVRGLCWFLRSISVDFENFFTKIKINLTLILQKVIPIQIQNFFFNTKIIRDIILFFIFIYWIITYERI